MKIKFLFLALFACFAGNVFAVQVGDHMESRPVFSGATISTAGIPIPVPKSTTRE